MDWQVYRVIFRLRTPVHIGQSKVGNVQLTRPYVTGRVLWGALTARLARDQHQGKGPATDPGLYQKVGDAVHKYLAFTYFYPALQIGEDYQVIWPWEKEAAFRARFLGSYASTALVYPHHSASEGSLHEVEFIAPRTQDDGVPVYLIGYVFAQKSAPDWQSALHRLQLGGERGYGWGRVMLAKKPELLAEPRLFGWYTVEPGIWPPVLQAQDKGNGREVIPLLAHTLVATDNNVSRQTGAGIKGRVEPLVGRETRLDKKPGFGATVSDARICWAPGATAPPGTRIAIGPYGIWEAVS